MKLMRLAMCVAAFAVIGKIALSEDVDVRALQAKLAAQEARLNDLQAKVNYSDANANYAGAPEGMLSISKQAVVTVGGLLNTRYFYNDVKVKNTTGGAFDLLAVGDGLLAANGGVAKFKKGDLTMADAKLRLKIDVNEHFDAWMQLDLVEGNGHNAFDNAEQYWVRWKNICNSGFGVLVGQNPLVFGQGGVGVPSSWAAGSGDGMNRTIAPFVPAHAQWDTGRIMQVTPYWEGLDGRFKWEVSFMQRANNAGTEQLYQQQSNTFGYWDGDTWKTKNYGFGTMSSRINFTVIEGLDLQASIANFYDKDPDENDIANGGILGIYGNQHVIGNQWSKNNTMVDLGFKYRPCFFPKLLVWSQYIHGWNVNNIEDYDSDVVNFGASFDITEALSFYAQGDYLRVTDAAAYKATGWAGWFGLQYKLPYGANFEAGYKYERVKHQNDGIAGNVKATGNTFFAQVGFDF